MNKKEAVAYAQITLEYMLSSRYDGELNIETFGLEMKQAFRTYPKNIVLTIADAKIEASKKLLTLKKESGVNEQ